MKKDILSLSLSELKNEDLLKNEKPFRIKQIYTWLHQKLVKSFEEMTNISKEFRQLLEDSYTIKQLDLECRQESKIDGTQKFLFTLCDGHQIESVFMRYKHGNSVCVSTQVGCRMGCNFCASTIDGLARNLLPSEMLSQIYDITRLTGEKISNIVLMGQGEPFDNYDNVMKFIKLINSEDGLNISRRNITLSTCGLVKEIIKFADEDIYTNLAVSLHAPNDDIRKKMMPIAYRYEIVEILDAIKYYIEKTNRRVTFEYSLVMGVNDTKECAIELSNLLRGVLCHVNLIPINPVKERNYDKPNNQRIENFKRILDNNSINSTIRREMGTDISGACGQLRRSYKKDI